jgi:hypothetical protein
VREALSFSKNLAHYRGAIKMLASVPIISPEP